MLKQYRLRNYHFQLILYLSALTVIGIMVIGSAQKSVQNKQIFGFALGMAVMFVISLIDYSFIMKLVGVYYVGIVGLLGLVEVMGDSSNNSQRWLEFGSFRFQPSELAKIVIILFFAWFFAKYAEKINSITILGAAFILIGIPLVLILKQPDLSTTIVTAFIFVILLFLGGLSYKIIGSVLGVTIPVGIVAVSYLLRNADELIAAGGKGYQLKRVMSWLDPTNPKYSQAAMQQQNAIMAVGSGQLWGKGLNNSVSASMKNSHFIIEPQTDFIFAVAGEELGFVGCAVIVGLLFLIAFECILIGRKAKDMQGQLICYGMAALVTFQSFVNICVATGLMPNTGVPLPFVSYGLTSLVSLYIGMGVVLNVGLQPKKYTKGVYI